MQGALDQIVQRFGTDMVAEVTGRSRRIVRKGDRLCVENRAGSANLAEAQAFMDDEKRILVFSDAGGTGRSYHADLAARNQRLRVHYLLEAGWKADTAIQGLGRSNRTNQAQPPLFRPIATDVKAEKRFLSTIARRLDTLGAITKGQRQTGGQGLFRADDNLESVYGRAALRQLYLLLFTGKVEGCSLQAFEDATGLRLTDQDGSLREELPPITTFLNRLLALTIDLQNTLFGVFEDLLRAKIEGAHRVGHLRRRRRDAHRREPDRHRPPHALRPSADRRRDAGLHDPRGASAIGRSRSPRRSTARDDPRAVLLVNTQSGRAAVQVPAPSLMLDDGEVERRVRLLRPMERTAIPLATMAQTHWQEADRAAFARRLGAGTRRDPGLHRQRSAHRHRPAAADLEAAAGRVHARLPAADRCRRARHRPAGLAGLGRAGRRAPTAPTHRAGRRLDRRARRPDGPRAPGRARSFAAPRSWASSASSSPASPTAWSIA